MNVLSLFDGCSCGQQALERANIKVNNYFASEIDKYAIKVTMANYPNTIQLGSVVDVKGADLPKIDLLIGGSPCQSFSFAGKRKGMATKCNQEILTLEQYLQLKEDGFQFEGQSYLFWEYVRILNEVKPKYFLLENVLMEEKWSKIITKTMGVHQIEINSNLLSAQNRRRLYWTNIGLKPAGLFGDLESIIEQPKDKGILLKDILESDVDLKYFLSEKSIDYINRNKRNLAFQMDEMDQKSSCITAVFQKQIPYNQIVIHNLQKRSADRPSIQKNKNAGGTGHLSREDGKTYCLDTACGQAVEYKSNIRRLTPIECERLQTMKDNYTNHVSDTQRYKMIGNGWTVEVIKYIFLYIE
jgi:DNA-cytosine methyltransferase